MIERYSRPQMAAIWEPQNRFDKWLQVEILVCEAMAAEGMIPQEAVETIKQKASFSVDRIQEIEE
ncbi:MAG: adenylosuccinate lyase, partial [Deltaproteobacteria bacterium]|nr:adenylosuccinate lyase [Deltaproteobacteria bacterium]